MRILIQRVKEAKVTVNNKITGQINSGVLIFAGFEESDNDTDIEKAVAKISKLRIFDDENGVMNLSVTDVQGEYLVVSQFTLHALTKKGNRPSYIKSAHPNIAKPLYNQFIEKLQELSASKVQTGEFGADMQVSLINDGPVTIWIDTKNWE